MILKHINEYGLFNIKKKKSHISCTKVQSTTFVDRLARIVIYFFDQAPEYKIVRGHWVLASSKVSSTQFKSLREVESVYADRRPRQPSWFGFPIGPNNMNLIEDVEYLLSSFLELCSAVAEKKSKMSHPTRGQGSHLGYLIHPKNTKLRRGRWDLLLPVKFCGILFSHCREV